MGGNPRRTSADRRRRGSPARVRRAAECIHLAGLGLGHSTPGAAQRAIDTSIQKAVSDSESRRRAEVAPTSDTAMLAKQVSTQQARRVRRPRVQFNLEQSTTHEVPAYAEIYGLHPRQFLFTQSEFMLIGYNDCLAPHRCSNELDEVDVSDSEDEILPEGILQENLQEDWVYIS
mmetsp:Transcript_22027/g.40480  ORF Transcript_22027/g.40480 Transcript_22027/m.40480 type:complete len:174 (-) Transcript_22027:58-579(-)